MRHMAKRAMSILLALLLCLTLFPATALAEEGTMRPVENGEDGGLSGTPAHTEEVDPESPVGDGVLDVPTDTPAALPQKPAADEIQEIVASGSCGENLTWTLDESGLLTISGSGAMTDWDYQGAPWYRQRESIREIHIDVGVISIGNYAFSNCSNLTIVSLPESATSIGDWSFIDCSSLTSVTIPEGVTSIGGRAFCNCGGLTRVTIPSSVTNIGIWAFSGCSSLTNVTIPDSVTTIGDYAFSSCGSLTSVTIPSSVTCINECVFLGCTSLTSVTIPSSVTIIGNNAFANCWSLTNVTIPSSITQIELGGFFGCYQLERIAIPASVTSIGEFAFSGCSDLKTISFFGDAPTIASNIFNPINYSNGTQRTVRTTALYPIDNPTWTSDELQNYGAEKLTWVGYRDEAKAYTIHFDANGGSDAPEDQIKGHNVDILLTDAVPTREDASFLGWSTQPDATEQECLPGDSFSRNADTTLYAVWEGGQTVVASGTCGDNLTWTLDDAGVLTISGEGKMWDWSKITSVPWFSRRESIQVVRIEESVTSIGKFAFNNCSALVSVTIPAGVTNIGDSAFCNCNSLTSVTIPEGVTGIGYRMFSHCSSLTNVTIPPCVISIGDEAFCACSSLSSVTIPAGVTTIGNKAFLGCNSLMTVTIPESVTTIGDESFGYCSSLTSVTIPDAVTTIGKGAFEGCSSLTSMTIPENVTTIGSYAFQGCSGLTSVTIPGAVISIGYDVFRSCSSLKSVFFMGNAPSIDESAFYNTHTTAVYPIDNPTWTADKLQNYGGTLTWVGYRDEAKAYTIHFNPNGGSDAPEDQIKGHNVDITLTRAVPSRENAAFLGWSTRRGANQPDYLPGDSFSLNADTTLYAVWKLEAPALPTEAVLTLGGASICAGQEFTVDLSMEKNPGLMFLSFTLDYDAASLEFLGAEEVLFTGWTVNKEKNFLTWDADGDRTDNGTLLRLRFLAKEEARTGETAIALTDLFATNYAEELLGIGSVPGEVMILPHTPGDVNGDGAVDGRDLVRLRKYLAGVPETEIIEANANANGDDVIDILDLIRLRKYLAKDDVILV